MKKTYWSKRIIDEADALLTESINHSHKRLQQIYLSTAKYCIDQLEQIYIKIQNQYDPENITRNTIYQYQGYFDKMKLCFDKLDSLGVKTNNTLSSNLIDLYKDNSKFIDKNTLKPAGIDMSFRGLDKRAETASQAIWAADGKSWSQRVWSDTAKLKLVLGEIIPTSMAAGQGVMKMTYELQKEFSVSFSKAKTLATTELTHIYAVSAQETFEEAGFDEYEISTSEDGKVCDECDGMDGKRFRILDTEHLPPYHPNCRCIIQPVIDIQKMVNLEYQPKF